MKLKYKAIVLSCMDPRFQLIVYSYLKKKIFRKKYPKLIIELKLISLNQKVENFR